MPVISTRDNLRLSNEEANNLTRECLCTAMMRLMSSTPFDRITIADIVELAGVSRMAFTGIIEPKRHLPSPLHIRSSAVL